MFELIRNVKQGEFIKRKADSKAVFVRGSYDKASKCFECSDTEDIGRSIWIKASKPVFIGFTY